MQRERYHRRLKGFPWQETEVQFQVVETVGWDEKGME